MGKKSAKASRKYAASGRLKKEIQARKKHQQIKKKIGVKKTVKSQRDHGQGAKALGDRNGVLKDGAKDSEGISGEDSEDDNREENENTSSRYVGMSVEDFMGGGFLEGGLDEDEDREPDDDDDEEDEDEDPSFSSIDDLDDEGEMHKIELAKLAEKDPEFFKYLQENDNELLEFEAPDINDIEDEVEEMSTSGARDESVKVPTLTQKQLRIWQRALLEHRSLRALRRLLIAFRSAVHMNDEDAATIWTIDNPAVYEKLVVTTLRYTPVVLEHHFPFKTLPDGKFKAPSQSLKLKAIQKMILSYFYNVTYLLENLSEKETLILAFQESSKVLPYVVSSRKAIKLYLKACLNQWSSAADELRIAAFLAMRSLSSSVSESMVDAVMKGCYLALVRSAKSTSAHSLPSINLMKNSASEIFCANHTAAYQHAFGYIRQLAIHLRSSMKAKTKDSYKQVYNWQFVHCVDFWSLVLARACDTEPQATKGQENELSSLIYPLTQVTLGALKLNTSSRSFPFHLCLLKSLVHLSRHTRTYIPLVPYIMPILLSSLSPSSPPKSSTLKPLDLETHLRAPSQYARTRVYLEGLLDETVYVLSEWLATRQVQGSIGFPEIMVPLTVMLKKGIKRASGPKEASLVKVLLERIQEGVQWIEQKRKGVTFGPRLLDEVRQWEDSIKLEDAPLNKYAKMQNKIHERRKKLLQKAREGEAEILED